MPTHNNLPARPLSALRRTVRLGWLYALPLLALFLPRIAAAQTYRVDTVKTTFEFAPQLVEDISGFDIDSAGRLHVFEAAQKRVRVYLEDGTHLKDRPTGLANTNGRVAVLPDSTLMVADNNSREFRAYDYDDNLLWTQPYFEANYAVNSFGASGDGSLVAGVSYYAGGQSYYRVWNFTATGQLSHSWSRSRSQMIPLSNGTTLFLVEGDNDPRVVKETTLAGAVLRSFTYTSPGGDEGGARDAAEDGEGGLWILDWHGYVIRADRLGNHLSQFGTRGTSDSQFITPYRIIARTDRIFVADITRCQILAFEKTGRPGLKILNRKQSLLQNLSNWPSVLISMDETPLLAPYSNPSFGQQQYLHTFTISTDFSISRMLGPTIYSYDWRLLGSQHFEPSPYALSVSPENGLAVSTDWNGRSFLFTLNPDGLLEHIFPTLDPIFNTQIVSINYDAFGNIYIFFTHELAQAFIAKFDKFHNEQWRKSLPTWAIYNLVTNSSGATIALGTNHWWLIAPDGNVRSIPAPFPPEYYQWVVFDRNGDLLVLTDGNTLKRYDDQGNFLSDVQVDLSSPDFQNAGFTNLRSIAVRRDGVIFATADAYFWHVIKLVPQWTETTAPTSTAVVAPAAPATGWHLGPVEVTFNSADDRHGSGLKRFLLDINGTVDILPDPLPDMVKRTFTTAGTHTIRYHGEDHAGNSESANTLVVRIDLAEPQVQASVVNRVLTLSATDDASGIEWIRYRVDNGPELTYSGPVTLPLTAKVVRYQVRDKAGRQSPQQSRVIGQFLKRVLFTPTSAHAGATVTVKVELLAAAPTGGVVLDLTSTRPGILAAPATLSIPSGSASGSFTATLGPVDDDTSVQLRASFAGTSVSGGLVVLRPAPKTLTITPSALFGGESANGTLVLRAKAPAGGQVVELTSLAPAALGVPATVTVPAGSDTARFTISSSVVDSDQAVLVSAAIGGRVATAMVTVRRNGPVSLTVSPTSVTGGTGTVGKVTLQRIAPAGGLLVDLRSTDLEATVPAQVLVPAGQRMATFTIATTAVSADLTAGIRAQRAGLSVEASLGILAPRLTTLTVAPSKLTGGLSAVGTVSLSGPAPVGGILVELASTHGSAAVPSTVLVPAGSSVATFPITTTRVQVDTTATISAISNLDTRTAVLTVRP